MRWRTIIQPVAMPFPAPGRCRFLLQVGAAPIGVVELYVEATVSKT